MRIIATGKTPALVEVPEGLSVVVVGRTPTQLDIDDKAWKQLHRDLATGKLNSATVKKKYAINEESLSE